MTPSAQQVRIEALLEHSDWLVSLARQLVRDGDAAEDLAQRTWLAALERPPFQLGSARQWLASVMRNFARQDRRAGVRREARESFAARPEALPSTLDVFERATLQRRVADAVLELDEPYRETILLRFFDGLPPREVARLQRVPVDTVRTRTARAIERLREKLDDRFEGGRGAWSAALGAWIATRVPLSAPFGAALLMNLKVKLLLALASLAAVAAVWWGTRDSEASSEPSLAVDVAPTQMPPANGEAPVASTVASERKDAVVGAPVPLSSSTPKPLAAPATPRQHGRVIDETERSVADVRVLVKGSSTATRTDAAGAFELEAGPGRLIVDDERWTTIFAGVMSDNPSAPETLIVVAPRVRFGGRVSDVASAPLAGARITVELPDAFRTRLRSVLDHSEQVSWSAVSDVDGRYQFDDVPGIAGARLGATLDGYVAHREELVGPAQSDVWITLVQPGADEHVLRGRVVDVNGKPVEDAFVAYGIDTTRTNSDGGFVFQKEDPESFGRRIGIEPKSLSAVKRGHLPARYEPEFAGSTPEWPAFVVLHLGRESLEIRGRVVDAKRKPLSGARVWVSNSTLFGAVDGEPTTLEGVLSGDTALWRSVVSADDGSFAIDGLLDQEYELQVMSDANLLRAKHSGVAAGSTGVELVLPTDQLYPRVAGRIVSRANVPVAGATIGLMCDAFQCRFQGEVISTSHARALQTVTDADGRFEIRDVPKSLVYLRIDGDDILPLEYGRYVEGDARFAHTTVKELPKERIASLEIVVQMRCHVRIELADPNLADEFAVLDENGAPLEVSVFEGNGRDEGERSPIRDGRSHTTGVPDSGRVLVLYKNDVEVARRGIEFTPGEVQVVRF
ncbi:MAG: sigma-70 family RNA polymerase sigma factor [Planctomycetes bacterium]|nr:sigma-70 family RNA polymerase sigma factor [Planctomycetota bacterium]